MIIVGLGNPGVKYESTRHNAGFMVLDTIADVLNVKLKEKGCDAIYGMKSVKGEKIVLAKPQTFMNLSGESVKGLVKHFKEDIENVLVIYDDIDIPLGQIRIRKEGSGGTHNGMKNIVKCLNTTNVKRIRIGLGIDKNLDLVDYVLGNLNKDEQNAVDLMAAKIARAIECFVEDRDFERLMQTCNGNVL